MENAVVFSNFKKKFKKNLVGPLNFSIEKGKVTAILGSSGAGKTVILNALTGATKRYSGDVIFNGISRKKIAHYNQNKLLGYYTTMDFSLIDISAYKYLKNICIIFGLRKKNINVIIKYWMEYFDLWTKKDSKLQDYSQGMKNRVNLIISLIKDPEILILDEPGANLDSYWRSKFKDLLVGMKNKSKTIVLTVHNIDEMVDIIDKFIIIESGNVIFSGTKSELNLFKKYKIAFSEPIVFPEIKAYLEANKIKTFKYNEYENSFIIAVSNDKLINHVFLYCLKHALPINKLEKLTINMESIHKALEGKNAKPIPENYEKIDKEKRKELMNFETPKIVKTTTKTTVVKAGEEDKVVTEVSTSVAPNENSPTEKNSQLPTK